MSRAAWSVSHQQATFTAHRAADPDTRHAPAPQGPADPHPPQTATGPGSALIGLRSALVLVLGILVGTGAGVRIYLAQHNTATAVLAGGAAFAGSVLFFHDIIAIQNWTRGRTAPGQAGATSELRVRVPDASCRKERR
ncbi:hypothetical protein OG756_40910 [Streptomyces sp. NBC_01310]|uniref:hypothetical protein n=1 Tax=Streptomyces sp. NBC_01310 TaxID=2903820 RepID=UPI0035B69EF4|nr:hypothetical protein OG756_00485 [Streptomyces sp. NBC_01310]WSJ63777.1 hypothetical protein OG756_40910 [Streptomyces sp. NBC_01310]